MEIRNLNTFLRVASLQNFTRAARELGYSQSNVSAQIKQLETELAHPLFDRIGKNIFLTTYGEALIPYARQIMATSLEMETFMKSEETMDGTIQVGMTDSLSELLLDDALIAYHRRFPHVHIELSVDSTSSLLDKLSHGQLDTACIIGNALPAVSWNIWKSRMVPIVIVTNPRHPLTQKESLSNADLDGQQFILMEETAPYTQLFRNFLAENRLECHPFLQLQSADTARRLVEREPFISVLPIYTVQSSIKSGHLCQLAFPSWSEVQYLQMVLIRSKTMTPLINGFLEEFDKTLEETLIARMT